MARSKTLPARKPERSDESLLLRSAESLGRMIGTLQRQLDEATRHLSQLGSTPPDPEAPPSAHQSKSKTKSPGARSGAASTPKRERATGARVSRASASGNGNAAKPRARKAAAKKKTRSR